eukprot:TRINITY_DN9148_c0_g1_i1.p1 TRINITY_DN9148_c0_g1~~TRINITY_DN9148_c0_g1_i1.p1  ORF type:complete len:470 (+),score=174.18 TRINITY_DN9148_c0_g1_i1:52-1410(+)
MEVDLEVGEKEPLKAGGTDKMVPRSTFVKWQIVAGIFAILSLTGIVVVGILANNVLTHQNDSNGPTPPPSPTPATPLVDPDSPSSALTTTDLLGQPFSLVFSDEFEVDGRNFAGENQTYWEAVDNYNASTNDLEFYSPSQVTTLDGSLVISATNTSVNGGQQNYTSGMVMSWNRFCFTGGIFESRVQLPGSSSIPGYWPAVWLLGNLGKAGWLSSTDNMWPYSYDTCTPQYNQGGQRITRCDQGENNEGMNEYQGRGAPEIDVLEAKVELNENNEPEASMFCTFHFGPKNPVNTSYDSGIFGNQTAANNITIYTASDAYHDYIGSIKPIEENFYSDFHVYRVEWEPDSYIRWLIDGQLQIEITADALKAKSSDGTPENSVGRRMIPVEPLYIIMNLALSNDWAPPSPDLAFPGQLLVDYVRVYQRPGLEQLSCSPPSFPTAEYISSNINLYT